MALIFFRRKLTELQRLIPPVRVGTTRSMKASYSASWKKTWDSGSNRFHKLHFLQRSTPTPQLVLAILTAGIVEYDCEKRERSMEDILGEY